MDHARKLAWGEGLDQARSSRPREEESEADSFAHLDRLLRVALAPEERPIDLPRNRNGLTEYDFAAAVDMVGQAAQAMRETQDRAQDAESRNQALLERVTEQLSTAETRIKSAETRARIAEARLQEVEARARESEARAKKAEEWLARIHRAVIEMLARNNTEAA